MTMSGGLGEHTERGLTLAGSASELISKETFGWQFLLLNRSFVAMKTLVLQNNSSIVRSSCVGTRSKLAPRKRTMQTFGGRNLQGRSIRSADVNTLQVTFLRG